MSGARLSIERTGAGSVRVAGRDVASFAGCDYLGLAQDAEVKEALRAGVLEYGVSAGASRETTGNTRAHERLEQDLARFLGLEAVLLVPDGYLSNLVLAQGLRGQCGVALVDREAHVSVRDGLAAARIRSAEYATCDPRSAAVAAREADGQRFTIHTDGAYPVLGRIAPARELLDLLPGDGWLVVDDCHATGVLGARGRGSHEHHGIADARLVLTGTLSKALGCFGGFIAGSRERIDPLRRTSHAHVGSTPIPPALACAASAAIAVLERDGSRLARLRRNTERVRTLLRGLAIATHDLPLPVFAWQVPSAEAGRALHERLLALGVLVPHVLYPDALGSYFRLAVSAAHDDAAVDRLADALKAACESA